MSNTGNMRSMALSPENHSARLVRVIDGDTIEVEVWRQSDSWVFGRTSDSRIEKIRLLGCDTPERGQPGFQEATAFVEGWFSKWAAGTEPGCILACQKRDKYGRILAYAYSPNMVSNLTQELLEAGLAVARSAEAQIQELVS